jgi:hypothetical protein
MADESSFSLFLHHDEKQSNQKNYLEQGLPGNPPLNHYRELFSLFGRSKQLCSLRKGEQIHLPRQLQQFNDTWQFDDFSNGWIWRPHRYLYQRPAVSGIRCLLPAGGIEEQYRRDKSRSDRSRGQQQSDRNLQDLRFTVHSFQRWLPGKGPLHPESSAVCGNGVGQPDLDT